jgi:hypothetical protein
VTSLFSILVSVTLSTSWVANVIIERSLMAKLTLRRLLLNRWTSYYFSWFLWSTGIFIDGIATLSLLRLCSSGHRLRSLYLSIRFLCYSVQLSFYLVVLVDSKRFRICILSLGRCSDYWTIRWYDSICILLQCIISNITLSIARTLLRLSWVRVALILAIRLRKPVGLVTIITTILSSQILLIGRGSSRRLVTSKPGIIYNFSTISLSIA